MEESAIFAIEQAVFNKKWDDATQKIYDMFMGFRRSDHFAKSTHTQKTDPDLIALYTRLASCIYDLFIDHTQYKLDVALFIGWSLCGRELRAVFTISGFYRSDFLGAIFDINFKQAIQQHAAHNDCFPTIEQLAFRLLLFSMLENEAQADFSIMFQFFPVATIITLLSLLSATVVLTPKSSQKREQLLALIPLLEKQALPNATTLLDVAAVWMLCSYAMRRDKHAIKVYLNRSIRTWLKEQRITPVLPYKNYDPSLSKPTMLVVLEFFRSQHSLKRSYGMALQNLSKHFKLIGLTLESIATEEESYELFEEMLVFNYHDPSSSIINPIKFNEQLDKIKNAKPDVIFYPSLGMHQVSIVLANLRLAPIQIMSFGHPASSFCDTIDYGIIEADYALEADDLFTEKMILLPAESFISQPLEQIRQFKPSKKQNPSILRIGISAILPKISADFLQACRKIAEQSKRRVAFFFFLNESELFYSQCKADILNIVPEAQILHRLVPDLYLKYLDQCDLYLSTFPFGGANSVIDAMCLGLPVVCLRGEEIAARTDSALIRRRGLPDWLTTHSEEEYIAAALRLIHNDQERLAINEIILSNNSTLFPENNLTYQQQENSFATACWHIYQKHNALQSSTQRSFTLNELQELNS